MWPFVTNSWRIYSPTGEEDQDVYLSCVVVSGHRDELRWADVLMAACRCADGASVRHPAH